MYQNIHVIEIVKLVWLLKRIISKEHFYANGDTRICIRSYPFVHNYDIILQALGVVISLLMRQKA